MSLIIVIMTNTIINNENDIQMNYRQLKYIHLLYNIIAKLKLKNLFILQILLSQIPHSLKNHLDDSNN